MDTSMHTSRAAITVPPPATGSARPGAADSAQPDAAGGAHPDVAGSARPGASGGARAGVASGARAGVAGGARAGAAARVRAAGDDPEGRLRLASGFYTGTARGYGRAELSFLRWTIARGVLDPVRGSAWWRAVGDGLLRDKTEARLLFDAARAHTAAAPPDTPEAGAAASPRSGSRMTSGAAEAPPDARGVSGPDAPLGPSVARGASGVDGASGAGGVSGVGGVSGLDAVLGASGAGGASSRGVGLWLEFLEAPSPARWFRAHNHSVVAGYLRHEALAEAELPAERFMINVALTRVFFTHALVARPRLALGRLAPLGRWLADPRGGSVGLFLDLRGSFPERYPLTGVTVAELSAAEGGLPRALDCGFIAPKLAELYGFAAATLDIPEVARLLRDGVPHYAGLGVDPRTLSSAWPVTRLAAAMTHPR